MTYNEFKNLFQTDEEQRFTNLIIPADAFGEELNLIGRKTYELDIGEVVRAKKYADYLLKSVDITEFLEENNYEV